MKHNKILLAMLAAGILTCSMESFAFKPDKEGHGHTKITRSITESAQEFLSDGTPIVMSKTAVKEIISGNQNTDFSSEFLQSVPHCDDEMIYECGQRIAGRVDKIVTALKNNNPYYARTLFGGGLHTLQDFYAHSNWNNEHAGGSFKALFTPSSSLKNAVLSLSARGCDTNPEYPDKGNNQLVSLPSKVTSGFFDVFSPFSSSAPSIKCDHGYNEIKGINKDDPTNPIHSIASSDAQSASEEYLKIVVNRIKSSFPDKKEQDEKLADFFDANLPMLGFVVDTTGSMGSIISGVSSNIRSILANYKINYGDNPNFKYAKFLLAQFNDPGYGPVNIGTLEQISSAASSLPVYGGGDCPELAFSGLSLAVSAAKNNAKLFVYTDASSKDSNLASSVYSAAKKKNIQINFVASGSCSPIDPAYYKTAEQTGGQVLITNHNSSDTIAILPLLTSGIGSQATLINQSGNVGNTIKAINIPVDSTVKSLVINAMMESKGDIKLYDPAGNLVLNDANNTITDYLGGRIFNVTLPTSGKWKIELPGYSTKYNVQATAVSNNALVDAKFVENKGRTGHQGLFAVSGDPLGIDQLFHAEFAESITSPQLSLIRESGDVIATTPLTIDPDNNRVLHGAISVPLEKFKILISGKDKNGSEIQRIGAPLYSGRTGNVEVDRFTTPIIAGGSALIRYKVRNIADPGTFILDVSQASSSVSYPDGNSITLGKNETKYIDVKIDIPSNLTSNFLNITAALKIASTAAEVNLISHELPIDLDSDGDGVADALEKGHSGEDPDFDGNGDGTPDYLQSEVVSTWDYNNKTYITATTSNNGKFKGFSSLPISASTPLETIKLLPLGAFNYTVTDAQASAPVKVNFYFPTWLATPDIYVRNSGDKNNWNKLTSSGTTYVTKGDSELSITTADGSAADLDSRPSFVNILSAFGFASVKNEALCSLWKEGTNYPVGTVVQFGEKIYTSLQSHVAQVGASWSPTNAAALWSNSGKCQLNPLPKCKAWVEGSKYEAGDVVTFGGKTYTAIITNTPPVNSGWTPELTPSLFSKGGQCLNN